MSQSAEPVSVVGERALRFARVSIVIPCYNEEQSLPDTLKRLDAELPDSKNHAFEFVFVDDHSADGTPQQLLDICASNSRVKAVRLGANAGSHVASRVGLEHSTGDACIFLTADLQEGPELVGPMLSSWRKGADVVATVAHTRDRGSLLSNLFAKLFYLLIKRASNLQYLEDVRAIPRLLDRKVVDRYCKHAPPKHNMGIWILQQNFNMAYVDYTPSSRRVGVSRWSFNRRVALAVNSMLEITPFYLVVWSGLGLFFMFSGLVMFVWSLAGGEDADFWPRLMVSSVLFMGGLILCASGAIGTYLWRLYAQFRHGLEYNVQWIAQGRNMREDSLMKDGTK